VSRSDINWYARSAVWLGVALLLLMAFTGAQVAVVTILAVVGICTGVVVLIYTIPWRATSPSDATSGHYDPPPIGDAGSGTLGRPGLEEAGDV
jgi:hypothetical protein